MIESQEQFTQKIMDTLHVLATRQSKELAAQITSLVVQIQNQDRGKPTLFYSEKEIPKEFLDICDYDYIKWCAVIPKGGDLNFWVEHSIEEIELPLGEILFFG